MKRTARETSDESAERCHWCHQPFPDPRDRKLHVSRLGAAAVFHRACFEEHEAASTES